MYKRQVFGQRSQLWWDVPVIDSFELIRDIYRVEPEAYRRQLDELDVYKRQDQAESLQKAAAVPWRPFE